MSSKPGADLVEAQRFLTLFREGEACTFQTFADAGEARDLARIMHGDIEQHGAELSALNERGAGIFVMVNFGDGKGRTAANVTGVCALFADLDGAPLEPVLSAGLEPHAVIESSPGRYHVYWLVADCRLNEFTPMQAAIAARFHSDPTVKDLPRVMRLPGFLHLKGEPFRTRIIQLSELLPYTRDEIERALGLVLNEEKPGKKAPARAKGGQAMPFAEGQRNAGLASIAGTMRRKGMSGAAIEAPLLAENGARCSPPLPDDEVRIIAASVSRYAPAPATTDGPAAPETVEMPDPIMPGARATPELPADVLPGIWGQHALAVAEATQTPPALAVMFTISVLATILQGRFEVAPHADGDYRETLSLWTVTCYPVGGRKTAVFNACAAPVQRWEKLAADRARTEIYRRFAAREVAMKRIERLKQDAAREDNETKRSLIEDEIRRTREDMPDEMKAPRCFTTNATPERTESLMAEQDGKIGIWSDEADTFLNLTGALRGGVASLDAVLKGHAGSAIRVDRQGREAHLDRPALSMGLIVQPESFSELAAGRRLRSTGVLARFLFAVPKSNIGHRNVRLRKSIPRDVADGYHDAVLHLLEGYEMRGQEPRVLPFSVDAQEPWLAFSQGVEQHQGEGGRYENVSDWTSKLAGHAARLAAVFEIASTGLDAKEVGQQSVERALALCRLLIPHAEAAFSMLGADDTDTDALAVLRWLRTSERREFTRREAQRAMHGRFSKVERLERALGALRDLYIISGEKKAATGGRASAFYLVNPKIYPKRVSA
jgi:putative DNA primase/helicase